MRKENKKLKDITFKDVKSFLKDERYKIKKKVSDFNQLPDQMFSEMNPVFVVSTGRVGSELLVRLMNESKIGSVYHEPRPRMFYGSKIAYELGFNDVEAQIIAFLNARYDLLKKTYLEDSRFVETNNRLSFFMVGLAELFPKAKFIHLIRHPGAFVRSGIRRKYYNGNENDDGRLAPLKLDPFYSRWEHMSDIEKIGWLWNATNEFIESSKAIIDYARLLTIQSGHLFSDYKVYQDICRFINHDILDVNKIEPLLKKPTNRQKQNDFPKWMDWSSEDKDTLKKVTPLGVKYGFWTIDD